MIREMKIKVYFINFGWKKFWTIYIIPTIVVGKYGVNKDNSYYRMSISWLCWSFDTDFIIQKDNTTIAR